MTKLQRFVAHNIRVPIIDGAWLDKNNRQVTAGPETWVKIKFTLDDGSKYVMSKDEMTSLRNCGWEIEFKGLPTGNIQVGDNVESDLYPHPGIVQETKVNDLGQIEYGVEFKNPESSGIRVTLYRNDLRPKGRLN